MSRASASSPEPDSVLRHVLVVGGTAAEWAQLTDAQWADRLADLGKVADHVGASWLTIRPFGGRAGDAAATAESAPMVRRFSAAGCEVLASSVVDGRERLVQALATIAAAGESFTDERVARLLNDPAEADPDLVLVLGAPNSLPSSLVWELAYCELVYVDIPWSELQPQHLTDAITSFTHRHRRFGGLD